MASFKFRSDGKVQICVNYGKKYNGQRKRYYKTVEYRNDKKLQMDAAMFLAEIMAGEVDSGELTTLDALFVDFMRHNGGVQSELKESTAARYRTLYANQIQPPFGHRKIKDINKLDVRDWIMDLTDNGKNKKTNKPLSPKTIKNALSLLSSLFKYAIDDLELINTNPCTGVKVPGNKKYTAKEYYSEAELLELLRLLSNEKERNAVHYNVILLALFTGMRTGEIMGLKWSDIDFTYKTIKIVRERISAQGKVIVDTPKTEESNRVISIPDFVLDSLKELRREENRWRNMEFDFNKDNYIMINIDGSPCHPYNTYKWFVTFQERHNLKRCTIHDLRHTHAALLSSLGVKIVDVANRLGHSNTRVTQEVYEYYFSSSDSELADKLNNYYDKLIKINI